MDRIADLIDLEEFVKWHAKRDQRQRLGESLREWEQPLHRREEILLQRQWRESDLERRIQLFASKSQNI